MDDRLQIQTAQNVALAVAPAGLGERILAWAADTALWVGYALLLFWLLGRAGADAEWLVVLLVAVPVLLYHLLFEVFFDGQTPGKRLLKVRVARLDGAQPTLGQYLVRWLLRFVDVTMTSGTVAVVAVGVTRRAQRLGDLAAGTTVIRQRRRVRLAEVLYPPTPPEYVPAVPEAEALSDADVQTLRAVLVRLRLSRRDRRSSALADRAKQAIEAKLSLGPSPLPAPEFLETVVRDHTALVDRYG
ncbi:RDD family protein, partial [Rubrivirga litoralis]